MKFVGNAGTDCVMDLVRPWFKAAHRLNMAAVWRDEQGTATRTTAGFRDGAFETDVAKSNRAAILEPRGIQQMRSR